jgi:hypothetical protein
MPEDPEHVDYERLDLILAHFFTVVKQSCGEDYKATSLKTGYGAITGYLMELIC